MCYNRVSNLLKFYDKSYYKSNNPYYGIHLLPQFQGYCCLQAQALASFRFFTTDMERARQTMGSHSCAAKQNHRRFWHFYLQIIANIQIKFAAQYTKIYGYLHLWHDKSFSCSKMYKGHLLHWANLKTQLLLLNFRHNRLIGYGTASFLRATGSLLPKCI